MEINELQELNKNLRQVIRKSEIACLNLQTKSEKLDSKIKNVFETIGKNFQKNMLNLSIVADQLEEIQNCTKEMKKSILKDVKKARFSAHMAVFNLKIEEARYLYLSNLNSEIAQIEKIISKIDDFYIKLRNLFEKSNKKEFNSLSN